MKDCSSASDITDIICLSERVPVGRTPLKQLVTKKACSFKRFPLLQHPVESLLVPVSLIYALFKTQQRFEVQVNKRNLKNVPNTWKEIRQLCRQQRHMIQASDLSGEMEHETAWLDKLLHKQHNIPRACAWGDRTKNRTD